jgi:hypothetical protein
VLASLERLGVTYVVVHTDYYAPDRWREVQERLDRLGDRLELEEIVGPGRIYRVAKSRGTR